MAIGDSIAACTSTPPALHYDIEISSANDVLASLSASPHFWGQYSHQEPISLPALFSDAEPAALLSSLSHSVAEPPSQVRMDNTPNLAGTFNINSPNNFDDSWLTTCATEFAGGEKSLGEGHPETQKSMHGLASSYQKQGRLKEAEKLELQVMEARKKIFGQEHPKTLMSMTSLAMTFGDQGRWKEAEELQLQVVETGKRVLGQEHPDTLMSINNLAVAFGDQGRWKEAGKLHVQVSNRSEKEGTWEGASTYTDEYESSSGYFPMSRTVERSGGAATSSNGNEKEGTWAGTSRHTDEYE